MKKLIFGMHAMTIESKDLVKIIETCAKSGVSHFRSGDIEIQFNGFVKHSEKDYPTKVEPIFQNVAVDPNFELQEKSEIEADDTENLMITDPAAYEEALFRDELETSDNDEYME